MPYAQTYTLNNARGNPFANQQVIVEGGTYSLFSYNTHVADYDGDTCSLTLDWDYSKTTLRAVKLFFGSFNSQLINNTTTKAQIVKSINKGDIKML